MTQIAVLKSFDFEGRSPEVLEIIERKVQAFGRGFREVRAVSYKGKRRVVLRYNPKVFDVPCANCISVD